MILSQNCSQFLHHPKFLPKLHQKFKNDYIDVKFRMNSQPSQVAFSSGRFFSRARYGRSSLRKELASHLHVGKNSITHLPSTSGTPPWIQVFATHFAGAVVALGEQPSAPNDFLMIRNYNDLALTGSACVECIPRPSFAMPAFACAWAIFFVRTLLLNFAKFALFWRHTLWHSSTNTKNRGLV